MADIPGKGRLAFPGGTMAPRPGSIFDPKTMMWTRPGAMSYPGTSAGITAAHKGAGNSRSVFIYDDTEFWVLQNGRIECGNCHKEWCSEIQAALVDNADGEDLWDNLEESYEFFIPMIPTHAQWAHVVLEPSTRFTSRVFEVNLAPPNMADLTKTTFIGHIHPGEGRIVIRSMIFDWFRSSVDPDLLRCESSSHKYSAQMIWEQDMHNSEKALTQHWSVWAAGACLVCADGGNAAFDDLVPEADERARVW